MKLFFLLISIGIIVGLGHLANAQAVACTKETVENISSRGITLGMDIRETIKVLSEKDLIWPASVVYNDANLTARITKNQYPYPLEAALRTLREDTKKGPMFGASVILVPPDKPKFDGILLYDLGFRNNRLIYLKVFYSKPRWENQEQFIRKMSEILKLPVHEDHLSSGDYEVRCGDGKVKFDIRYGDSYMFSMSVTTERGLISDTFVKRDEDKRRQQRERDIKDFKP